VKGKTGAGWVGGGGNPQSWRGAHETNEKYNTGAWKEGLEERGKNFSGRQRRKLLQGNKKSKILPGKKNDGTARGSTESKSSRKLRTGRKCN